MLRGILIVGLGLGFRDEEADVHRQDLHTLLSQPTSVTDAEHLGFRVYRV